MKMKKRFAQLIALCLALSVMLGAALPSAEAAAKLSSVKNFSVSRQEDDEVKLKWSKVPKASGYQVYRYNTKTKKWKKIRTTSKTRVKVENLTSATKYKFRVRAYRKNKKKNTYSSYKTLSVYTTPDEVKKLKLSKHTKSSVTLSWRKVSRATGYQVYVYNAKKKKYEKKATVKSTKATLKKLSTNTVYKVKVRAYKTAGKKKVYGDYSDTLKVTTTGASSSKITSKDAESIALKHAGFSASQVKRLKTEFDREDNIYEVSFEVGRHEYDYEISAKTGKILDWEKD